MDSGLFFCPFFKDEERLRNLQRKTKFTRFTQKSMHTLANLTKDKDLKTSITNKKVAIQNRWKKLAHLTHIEKDLVPSEEADDPDGLQKKKKINVLGHAVLAYAAKERERMALESTKKTDDDNDEVHEGDYDDIAYNVSDETVREHEQTVSAEINRDDSHYSIIRPHSERLHHKNPQGFEGFQPILNNEDVEMDTSNFQLKIPKVENDHWPDVDTYAQPDSSEVKDNVLF